MCICVPAFCHMFLAPVCRSWNMPAPEVVYTMTSEQLHKQQKRFGEKQASSRPNTFNVSSSCKSSQRPRNYTATNTFFGYTLLNVYTRMYVGVYIYLCVCVQSNVYRKFKLQFVRAPLTSSLKTHTINVYFYLLFSRSAKSISHLCFVWIFLCSLYAMLWMNFIVIIFIAVSLLFLMYCY